MDRVAFLTAVCPEMDSRSILLAEAVLDALPNAAPSVVAFAVAAAFAADVDRDDSAIAHIDRDAAYDVLRDDPYRIDVTDVAEGAMPPRQPRTLPPPSAVEIFCADLATDAFTPGTIADDLSAEPTAAEFDEAAAQRGFGPIGEHAAAVQSAIAAAAT